MIKLQNSTETGSECKQCRKRYQNNLINVCLYFHSKKKHCKQHKQRRITHTQTGKPFVLKMKYYTYKHTHTITNPRFCMRLRGYKHKLEHTHSSILCFCPSLRQFVEAHKNKHSYKQVLCLFARTQTQKLVFLPVFFIYSFWMNTNKTQLQTCFCLCFRRHKYKH